MGWGGLGRVAVIAVVAAWIAGAAGCSSSGSTGIVVDISTNCEIPADIDQVLVRVTNPSGKLLLEVPVPVAPGSGGGFLGRLGLSPEREPPSTAAITIEAVGLRGKQEVVIRRASLAFVRDRVVRLPLELRKECLGLLCTAMGKTCVVTAEKGVCADPAIDSEALPPFDPKVDSGGTGGAMGTPSDGPVADAPRDLPVQTQPDAGPPADVPAPADTRPADSGPAPADAGPDLPVVPPAPDAASDQGQPMLDAPGLRAQGAACTAGSECASGFCADQVCCNRACSERCHACRASLTGGANGACLPLSAGQSDNACPIDPVSTCGGDGTCDGNGACRRHMVGTTCGAASCQGNTFSRAATCSAQGTCTPPAPQACGFFICNPAGCLTACQSDDQCVGQAYCEASNCIEKKPNGAGCTQNRECKSGTCLAVLLGLFCS
jgi:hypothetical protein